MPGPPGVPAAVHMGDRLLVNRAAWRAINGEALLLQGVRADWKDSGSQGRLARIFPTLPTREPSGPKPEYRRLLEEELQQGVVKEVSRTQVKWLNPTFLVPKAGGKFRKILDCTQLNTEMRNRHFKMESAEDVLQLARPGDWATSLDFKSAFNHIHVDSELRPYLCFFFAGHYYQYQAMPFGLKQAPRTFTRLMKRAVAAVRTQMQLRMIFYMDDTLLLFETERQALLQTPRVAAFFTSLGWTISTEKCQLTPSQTIDFLGWRWRLADACLVTTPTRRGALLKELKHFIRDCESRSTIPTRALASLIGSLNFLRLQFQDASLHLQALDRMKVLAVRRAGWQGQVQLNPSALGDLKWWARCLSLTAPRPWMPPPTKARLTTDASPSGWGAELRIGTQQTFAFGQWTLSQRLMTSNAKELTAVRMSLRHFTSLLENLVPLSILVVSDNTTTVHLINHLKAAPSLCQHLRRLLTLCRQMRISLTASYLPGKENDTADRLSRMGALSGFYLKPEVLQDLLRTSHFIPTLDVFAREPGLRTGSASEQRGEAVVWWQGGRVPPTWTHERLFLHPPLNKILPLLHRLQAEPVPSLMITPAWTSQPWSPLLAQVGERQFHLGTFEAAMETTPDFRRAGWRLPPGKVVASLLATRTTRAGSSSPTF